MAILNTNTKAELKKAMTTTATTPDFLPQNDLEPVMGEELLKLQPLAKLISVIQAEGLTHEYRTRTSHPMGWFEGESTVGDNQNGAYTRNTVQLKIQRFWGAVSGFSQAVTAPFIDAMATEVEGALIGMADLMEFGALFGTANDIGFTGDQYQYSGMMPRLFSYAPGNIIDAGGAKVTLDMLDQAVAKAYKNRQTRNDPALWMMGLRMKQVVDGLQTKVQMPITSVVLADGKIEMPSYYRRPILETDYVTPEDTSTSPAATGTIGGNTGTMAAGSYTYRIASVTSFGEQVAGTVSAACVADSTHTVANLTWTADAEAKNYMIFRKLGSGSFQLLDIIPALTYDANGKVNGTVASYTDTGAKSVKAVKPLETGEQQIVLANVNPQRGLAFMGLVDGMGQQIDRMVQFMPLATRSDSYEFFLRSFLTMRLKYPNLISAVRHVKVS